VDPLALSPIQRRRTFAIISHPDAGKTTLTEKFLLYGGALHLAGAVKARKNQRATASDWMELEKKRGISISSTVLQFDYRGYRLNLLDTPGHRDFSEDTYRVLTAVDAAVMVIDAAKGIEAQTRKLFEVCRRRGIPIFTFINKLDHPCRDPLDLVDELEKALGLEAYPMNWPLGTGMDFRGVYDRGRREAHFFERTLGGATPAPVSVHDLSDEAVRGRMDEGPYHRTVEELGLLDHAGADFDTGAVAAGKVTPVFFGSALNNFGVELLLGDFTRLGPAPAGRKAGGAVVAPEDPRFSGFVFKIQGNMDPRHRDRVAFVRVCSGVFRRDAPARHVRTGRTVKLSNAHSLFGRERETVAEALPGDIVGLVGHADFAIGDTLSDDPALCYDEIPRFPPECFSWLHNPSPSKYKAFRKGLEQMLSEGIVRALTVKGGPTQAVLLSAVGPLQFEVVQYRLESEYGASSRLEAAPWAAARWVDPAATPDDILPPSGAAWARDEADRPVLLFPNDWSVRYFQDRYPAVGLYELPMVTAEVSQ
jgi:peptide chain release factor 3